ncbi:hypothetical protein TIFTF001_022489 [Ficus carica]|uniref:Uncharacterized protein n=1 Tax=Ficus carica TaxID=3494 RepID=A0AA88AEL0_FICCA|nr:hypothetical protein TIFTF001_022489 [Ficus carica]
MATSISATGLCSSFHGSWGSSIGGEDLTMLAKSVPTQVRVGKPVRSQPMMKNVNEGKGLFAPIVVVTRQIIGKKRFNQLRGKAIALHSQAQTRSKDKGSFAWPRKMEKGWGSLHDENGGLCFLVKLRNVKKISEIGLLKEGCEPIEKAGFMKAPSWEDGPPWMAFAEHDKILCIKCSP